MHSPYHVLNVSEQADDTSVKQAYLQQIKNHPPERDPQRFREIQQAYELIKDNESRLRHALFYWPNLEFEQLLDHAFQHENASQPMPTEDFLKLFNAAEFEKALAKKYTKPL
jgi:DnaJ-class molecular chaperone with C-terminal Zn finger domain